MTNLQKRETFLPFSKPSIDQDDIDAVVDVLSSGWLTTGNEVKEFENEISAMTGATGAVGLTSCTGGLHIALAALSVGSGDEVIVPTLTFVASAHVVTWLGATPVLVDIDPKTYNIDPVEIEKAITPRTKVIMPVHYGGNPCEMDAIMAIAKKHKLHIVEDAAHAIGATYKGRHIGVFGDVTAFSFYATKNMTTAEGGVVVTMDAALLKKLRRLSYFGVNKDAFDRYGKCGSWYYEVEDIGYKYNMDNIQGALGRSQLRKLSRFNAKREQLAARYTRLFAGMRGIQTPTVTPGAVSTWHLYPIVIDEKTLGIGRSELIDKLKEWNVGTSVHFIPLHLHPFYQKTFGYKEGDFPVAERVYSGLLSLPLHPSMTEEDVDYVVEVIRQIVR